MYKVLILLSLITLSCTINTPRMCPNKLSPHLRNSLNQNKTKLKVIVKVKRGYEDRIKGTILGRGFISTEITKKEIYELSCKDWVLFIDTVKPLKLQ